MITVDLLRHGELEGGVKYRGRTDDPLTMKGRSDMDGVWSQIGDETDMIITSPLSRCREPASQWAEAKGIACMVDDRIAEMFYGEWDGLTPEEITLRYPGVLEQWRADPESVEVPGGESIYQLRDRIARFWSDICSTHDGQHLLVVAHSGSFRMLIAHVLDAPVISTRSMEMPYACWSRVEVANGVSRLCFHNK